MVEFSHSTTAVMHALLWSECITDLEVSSLHEYFEFEAQNWRIQRAGLVVGSPKFSDV